MNWLRKHFQRYREKTAWEFCWRIAVEGTALSFLSAFILSLILVEAEREFPDWGAATVFLFLVVIAPLAETLLFQALPIFVARKLNASFNSQIIVSTAIFAACHFLEGIATGISAGVIGVSTSPLLMLIGGTNQDGLLSG